MRLSVVAACAAAMGIVSSAVAQDATDVRPTVAVMNFDNGAIGPSARDYDGLTRGIGGLLIVEMSKNPKIRVVERDQVQHVLDEHKLVATGQVTKETAVQVGKLLGARHMIFGGFVIDTKGNTRLVARSVNVETSQIEYVESVDGSQANLMTMINQLAGKLNSGLKFPDLPKPMRDASIESAKKVPFQAAMLYSRALAAADGGDRMGALDLLQKSLASFPDYEPAKLELRRLEK
ncbi:MAG: CsgG/HfaB family protein [Gemmatimonadaceae bacterium]